LDDQPAPSAASHPLPDSRHARFPSLAFPGGDAYGRLVQRLRKAQDSSSSQTRAAVEAEIDPSLDDDYGCGHVPPPPPNTPVPQLGLLD
ncbi:hypothetical protein AURDEDRAFT_159309, partial [Auricularia subglabra TFB-10046 SS5]